MLATVTSPHASPLWGLALLAWGLALPSLADSRDFRSFSTDEGLPQLSLMAMAQDAEGQLWVGTQDGLARFDGLSFETFGVEHGLPNDFVSALAVSPSNELLIATRAGLAMREPREGRFRALHTFREPRPGFTQLVVVESHVWCVGPVGLFRWDGRTLFEVEAFRATEVHRAARDGRGRLWVATLEGLLDRKSVV